MQQEKYLELEERVTRSCAVELDEIRQLEARERVRQEIEVMKAEGKALTLSDEELSMLESFRRFKLRMRRDGEVFTWQTRRPEGVQLVQETAEVLHPNEVAPA